MSDTAPRIIKVRGTIDANSDDGGKKLTCADYAAGTGYSLTAYLKAFDPSAYGRAKLPSGTQESARAAAQKKQAANTVFKVPANTPIVGVLGTKAGITGGMLKPTVNWTPTLTAGLESSADNLATELARTAGAGVLS